MIDVSGYSDRELSRLLSTVESSLVETQRTLASFRNTQAYERKLIARVRKEMLKRSTARRSDAKGKVKRK